MQPSAVPAPPDIASSFHTKVNEAFMAHEASKSPVHHQASEPAVLVAGTKHKRAILAEYEATYRTGPDSITTRKKGELVIPDPYDSRKRMRPSLDKQYRVIEVTLENVIATVLKEFHESFDNQDFRNLTCLSKDFASFIPNIVRWLKIDFSSLRDTRYDYESQSKISTHRVEMASAAMVHFGMDPGKFVRWMGGEYTGNSRDVSQILSDVKDHILPSDYDHLKRILMQGCPSRFCFDEDLHNKQIMMNRGNSKSFVEHPDLVNKTMNKEDRYSHVIPLHQDILKLSPYCRHTTQTLVIKPGKNPRICWDASTKRSPDEIVLNEVTSTENEAIITFGNTKKIFLKDLYNARISFPDAPILLALADVKACYKHPRIHPDVTGAHGFHAEDFYFLATAMVFGSRASASSWEAFRRAIEALSKVYANRPDLVIKHKEYLDMINWATIDPDTPLTPATPCSLNPGLTLSPQGDPVQPARIYVDDALMLAIRRQQMLMTLAAVIESIFVIMGRANTLIRQCPLAMDKWIALVVGPIMLMLGIIVDTNKMTVAIPADYAAEVHLLLESIWHVNRKSFTVNEAQILTGKLGHLAEGAPWVHHLLTQMYADIARALSGNKALLLDSSQEFRDIAQSLRSGSFACTPNDLSKHVSFALKRAARMVHHSKTKHYISKHMRQEIEFFRDKLNPLSDIRWETPIAHIVKRMPTAISYGDSSLTGMGGYSLSLQYWWHIPVPGSVQQRTLLHRKDNEDGQLISINVLEYVTVIINYIAALHVVTTTNVTVDPYPVLLNVTDNASALSWTLNACRKSRIGQRLARFFCSLLINSPLGINSKWISTHDNTIADEISRTKSSLDAHSQLTYDYSMLQQTFPALNHCSFFQLKPEVSSLVWDIVLTEKWPTHEEVKRLKQNPLGKLTTSTGAS